LPRFVRIHEPRDRADEKDPGETEMKILLLVSRDVSVYYSAKLMLRGHQIITHDRRVSRSERPADWMPAITQYMECDGCLLVSDDPQMTGIADWFGNSGKPVWHRLADVPGVKIRHYRLLYVLVPVFVVVVGALVIKQPWFREEAKPVPVEEKPPIASEVTAPLVDKTNDAGLKADERNAKNPPIASEVTAPVVDKTNDAGPKADERNAKNCEKELRRTGDLLRFSVNRIQAGEETQSIVADMRQQAERVSAVCPEFSDR
jgi:hypothetical protein